MGEQLDDETLQRVVRRAIELDGDADPAAEGVDSDHARRAAFAFGSPPTRCNWRSPSTSRPGTDVGAARPLIGRVASTSTVVLGRRNGLRTVGRWLTVDTTLAVGEWARRVRAQAAISLGMQRRRRSVAGGAPRSIPSDRHRRGRSATIRRSSACVATPRRRSPARRVACGVVAETSCDSGGRTGAPVSAVMPGVALSRATSAMTKHGSTNWIVELIRLRPARSRRAPRHALAEASGKVGSATDRPAAPITAEHGPAADQGVR